MSGELFTKYDPTRFDLGYKMVFIPGTIPKNFKKPNPSFFVRFGFQGFLIFKDFGEFGDF